MFPTSFSRLVLHFDSSKSFCLNSAHLYSLPICIPSLIHATGLHNSMPLFLFSPVQSVTHQRVGAWERNILPNIPAWDNKKVAMSRWLSKTKWAVWMGCLEWEERLSTRREHLCSRKLGVGKSSWKQSGSTTKRWRQTDLEERVMKQSTHMVWSLFRG